MSENYENKDFENEINEEEEYLIDLFDEDGNKQTFVHLDTVMVGDSEYVVCVPDKEIEDDEVEEVIILKMETDENDEYILVPEEDNEILDKAYELFRKRNEEYFDWED